jgi:hypothetical protein
MFWYYKKDGLTQGPAQGPVDSAALTRLIRSGGLSSNDLVLEEHWDYWRVLGKVDVLADYLPSSRRAVGERVICGETRLVAEATPARTFAGI